MWLSLEGKLSKFTHAMTPQEFSAWKLHGVPGFQKSLNLSQWKVKETPVEMPLMETPQVMPLIEMPQVMPLMETPLVMPPLVMPPLEKLRVTLAQMPLETLHLVTLQ